MQETSGWAEFLLWFVFDGAPGERPAGFLPQRAWNCLAFAVVAAAAFVAIVTIDLSVTMVRRFGFPADGSGSLNIRHGLVATAMVILFGAVGAFVVAGLAVLSGLLQINTQTAVVAGVTWQVVYAKMLARMLETGSGAGLSTPSQEVQPAAREREE